MGLTRLLVRAGAARPHVLVVTVPGGTAVRLAAEEQLRRRGWPAAIGPANADVLLVAGAPALGIADAVEAAWAAVPAPRARVQATTAGEVPGVLDAARAELTAAGPQHRPASMSGGSHRQMPGGLPMADRGPDRDGLALDQLHVPLGPLLPDWPPGLVIRLTMQGDVVQHAAAEAMGLAADPRSFWTEPWRRAAAGEPVTTGTAAWRRAAAHLDSLARFLSVAGWDDAAMAARALRDGALSGSPAPRLAPAVRRLAHRVGRSRVLAWSTHGIGTPLPGEEAVQTGAAALGADSDVTVRYRHWCRDLAKAATLFGDASPLDPARLPPPRGQTDGTRAPSAALLAALPRLLEGAEFAAARLIVASLDPDLDELSPEVGAGHGH